MNIHNLGLSFSLQMCYNQLMDTAILCGVDEKRPFDT